MPFCRPEPLTSTIDSDGKPSSSSSMRIGSNASWRTNASTFFISLLAPPRVCCGLNASAPLRMAPALVLHPPAYPALPLGDLALELGLGPQPLGVLAGAMGLLDARRDLLGRLGVALVFVGRPL